MVALRIQMPGAIWTGREIRKRTLVQFRNWMRILGHPFVTPSLTNRRGQEPEIEGRVLLAQQGAEQSPRVGVNLTCPGM